MILKIISETAPLEGIVWGGYDTIMNLIMSSSIFVFCFKLENIIVRKNHLRKVIQIIGNNTLGIYLIHALVGNVFRKYYIAFNLYENIFINIAYVLIIIITSLLITLFLKKLPLIKELFRI